MSDQYRECNVELHERVAKIETEVAHIDKLVSERTGKLTCIEDKIDNIERDLEKYRGMVGAILLVGTAITTFFKLFWADVAKFFK
jgi:peptidoglycan hydrolase CwlO-like protein